MVYWFYMQQPDFPEFDKVLIVIFGIILTIILTQSKQTCLHGRQRRRRVQQSSLFDNMTLRFSAFFLCASLRLNHNYQKNSVILSI